MDYLLTIVLFILGVCFHVMQKIMILKASFPQLKFRDIWNTFFKQEWDSLVVSGLVLCVAEIALFIAVNNKVTLPNWLDEWGMYLIPLVLGYSGQRIAYKYLQTAEAVLEKKVENLK